MSKQNTKAVCWLGTSLAVSAGVLAGCAQHGNNATSQAFELEYGPTNDKAMVAAKVGGGIQEVILALGSPYSSTPLGDGGTVYRWGHGIHKADRSGNGSIVHNELLVVASNDGRIIDLKYFEKANASGPYALIAGPMP